jgi:hypothetical protein
MLWEWRTTFAVDVATAQSVFRIDFAILKSLLRAQKWVSAKTKNANVIFFSYFTSHTNFGENPTTFEIGKKGKNENRFHPKKIIKNKFLEYRRHYFVIFFENPTSFFFFIFTKTKVVGFSKKLVCDLKYLKK